MFSEPVLSRRLEGEDVEEKKISMNPKDAPKKCSQVGRQLLGRDSHMQLWAGELTLFRASL
jgi:hypothetical protein